MKFVFQKMHLFADHLYALIVNPVEMQLQVTEDTARIVGSGFGRDIEGAFSLLVYDWRAVIVLDRADVDLPPGEYYVMLDGERVIAGKDEVFCVLPNGAVVVEVVGDKKESI